MVVNIATPTLQAVSDDEGGGGGKSGILESRDPGKMYLATYVGTL